MSEETMRLRRLNTKRKVNKIQSSRRVDRGLDKVSGTLCFVVSALWLYIGWWGLGLIMLWIGTEDFRGK